ncbi:MAG: thiamine pyrophosphate-dependent dehydrogenase E1 component subunit alpha [bacterium]
MKNMYAGQTFVEIYRRMLKIRMVQQRIEKEYPKDEMKTPVHLCIGQEAIPVGVCINLKKDDYVFSNYRGHGHYLAKGGNLKALIAELYGRKTGCSRGRGGSMHLIDTSVGLMGSSSIVAGGIPIATGSALVFKLNKEKRVAVVFFGDGAVDEGVLSESINFSVLKKLPVIYVCENNFYAVCSPQKKRQSLDNIYKRFAGLGIPGFRADGNDITEVFKIAEKVINEARNGRGPALIEFRTYRWCGHSGGGTDVDLGYRSKEELNRWKRKCPIMNFEKLLINKGLLTLQEKKKIEKNIKKEIDEAFSFAKNSPLPDKGNLLKYLYQNEN